MDIKSTNGPLHPATGMPWRKKFDCTANFQVLQLRLRPWPETSRDRSKLCKPLQFLCKIWPSIPFAQRKKDKTEILKDASVLFPPIVWNITICSFSCNNCCRNKMTNSVPQSFLKNSERCVLEVHVVNFRVGMAYFICLFECHMRYECWILISNIHSFLRCCRPFFKYGQRGG